MMCRYSALIGQATPVFTWIKVIMSIRKACLTIVLVLASSQAVALSMAPEEFHASTKLACVLAEQSLGFLSEEEYGLRTHTVLDDFDEADRDAILAKALGYFDGLMFAVAPNKVNQRLEEFVASNSCIEDGYQNASYTFSL
jgi:hypothetical protein